MGKEFRSICLPYCLKRQKDGSFIVLNRNYKPLGFNTNDHLEYEAYPIFLKIKGLTKASIKHIAYNAEMKDDFIYLYDDNCIPTRSKEYMQSYLAKLERLASYIVD
jgi:hypothetical protein